MRLSSLALGPIWAKGRTLNVGRFDRSYRSGARQERCELRASFTARWWMAQV